MDSADGHEDELLGALKSFVHELNDFGQRADDEPSESLCELMVVKLVEPPVYGAELPLCRSSFVPCQSDVAEREQEGAAFANAPEKASDAEPSPFRTTLHATPFRGLANTLILLR